jgi:glycosyltransferase involved in cell wall biosynthesis
LIKGKLKETQERKMVDLSDVLTAVSEVDAQYYKKLENQKSDKVRVVSNAIDLTTKETNEISINYFKHPALTIIGSFGSKESAMDVGTKWFIDKVWDQVRTAVPEATLYLVGNGSDRNWESNKVRGIYVLGRVPSTAEILRLTDINLVPLLFESGTRFKILESGMYSTAVVSTTLGAEGLKIVDGRDILLADTPSEFRDAVLTLMDESLRKKLGANLNQKIIDSYTTDNLRKECLEVLETLEG